MVIRAIEDKEWFKWANAKTDKTHKTMLELRILQVKLLSLGGDWVALLNQKLLEHRTISSNFFLGLCFMYCMLWAIFSASIAHPSRVAA
jgi:hypothetical protein